MHSCSEPCSPPKPSTSLAPHQGSKVIACPKFPISLSVPKPVAQTVLYLLWKVHSRVSEMSSSHSSSLLQDLGYIVLTLHEWFRETCAVLHWIMVESRAQESCFSVRPSEKQKSTLLVTVQFQSISCESMLG